VAPTLETVKEHEEKHGTPEEHEDNPAEEQETSTEETIEFQEDKKPITEDENFLELKESPWLISKTLEEEVREEALERGKSVGEVFRALLRSSLKEKA